MGLTKTIFSHNAHPVKKALPIAAVVLDEFDYPGDETEPAIEVGWPKKRAKLKAIGVDEAMTCQ